MKNKYEMKQYDVDGILFHTQKEVDEHTHWQLGILWGSIERCFQFKAQLEKQGLDTTFIDKELDEIDESLRELSATDLSNEANILSEHWMGCKEDYLRETGKLQ